MEMSLLSMFTAGATVLQAVGAITSANDEAAMMKYNAAVAGQNAQMALQNEQIALMNAERERQSAALEEARQREVVRRAMGSAAATRGKSGITQAGSAIFVTEDSVIQGELDALLIQHKGTIASNNYKTQAAQFRLQSAQFSDQSKALKIGAKNTKASGLLSGLGLGLIGGAKLLGSTGFKGGATSSGPAGGGSFSG